MANVRFLYENLYRASATVLTASSEASALPVGGSQQIERTLVWRSNPSTGEAWIDIDLGSVLAVASVAVADVRLVGSGVLKLQERGDASSPGTANDVVTLGTQDAGTRAAAAFFTQSHRHWRLLWTNPGADNDYAELGFAHLGGVFEPAFKNVQLPMPTALTDPSVVQESPDGQQTTTLRTFYQSGSMNWLALDADVVAFDAMYRSVGRATPFFVVIDSTLTWTVLLALFATAIDRTFERGVGFYRVRFDWREAR